jgi:hypothetical protein
VVPCNYDLCQRDSERFGVFLELHESIGVKGIYKVCSRLTDGSRAGARRRAEIVISRPLTTLTATRLLTV